MAASPSSPVPEPAASRPHVPSTAQAEGGSQQRERCTGHALLAWRRRQLQLGGSASELDWLLDLRGGLRWSSLQRLILSPEQTIELAAPLAAIEALWQRHRNTGEPLQYLVGRCPWRDLELVVGPGALIPRQETERMVELSLELLGSPQAVPFPALWADLGTGTGCLAAALARTWPESKGIAVDLSGDALALAQRNLELLGLQEQVVLKQGSWWEPLRPHWGELELVVANPPYIPDGVWRELEPVVREHEPRMALSSGADGLEAIRAIAAGATAALAPGGWLLLEHHHDQSPAVLALLEAAGLQSMQAHCDLEGRARFASARRSPEA